MRTSAAIRLITPPPTPIGSMLVALRGALHWYGTQMIKQGEVLRQSGGAPF